MSEEARLRIHFTVNEMRAMTPEQRRRFDKIATLAASVSNSFESNEEWFLTFTAESIRQAVFDQQDDR